MRIKATVMTPLFAIFTVLALIATGVVLGQARGGDADATLLDSVPDLATGAGTNGTATGSTGGMRAVMVAGAEMTVSTFAEDFEDDEYEVEHSYSESAEDDEHEYESEHESEDETVSPSEYESDSHYEEED